MKVSATLATLACATGSALCAWSLATGQVEAAWGMSVDTSRFLILCVAWGFGAYAAICGFIAAVV